MQKKAISLMLIILMAIPIFSGCLEENSNGNVIPSIEIIYPTNRMTVSGLVKIYGISFDKDGDNNLKRVEISINDSDWNVVEGMINCFVGFFLCFFLGNHTLTN